MAKAVAIVLAAGQGRRMNSKIAKQYLLLDGRPILAYALQAFEKSFLDEIVLVVEKGYEAYCQRELVEKYGFHKVKQIVSGGEERYHSVFYGLQCIEEADYVYIHDGARPFVSQEILERARKAVMQYEACVVGMPVKDTIKIADGAQFVADTPKRGLVWQVQTPQVFSCPLIKNAYEKLMKQPVVQVTDDAMAVETMLKKKVYLVEGSYENIKITTQDDLAYGQLFCKKYWIENEK